MSKLAPRYASLPSSLDGCHQVIEEQRCLIREYRQQGKELTELVSALTDQVESQDSVNERTLHYVDHISHEFRTPLSVILDYLTILNRGFSGSLSDEQKLLLQTITVHANELSGMVDDILDVRRIDAGVLAMNRQVISVGDVVEKAFEVLVQKAEPRGVSIHLEIDEVLSKVFVDAEKVGRVVLNLGMNAIKFCGKPGKVVVSAKQVDRFVTIVVRDNGEGIAANDKSKIFERFEQLDLGSWCSTRGFGLGLVIAKELVELNFGTIAVESSPAGTEFSFSLPSADLRTIVQSYASYISANHPETQELEVHYLHSRTSLPNTGKIEQFFCRSLHSSEMLVPAGRGWLLFSKPSAVRKTIERIRSLLDRHSQADALSSSVDLMSSLVYAGRVREIANHIPYQMRI